MTATALRFQLGARTVASIRRRLLRVALSLDEALAGAVPTLPALGDHDGFLVTSLPAASLPAIDLSGRIALVRQRYRRYWTDLAIGHDAWLAGLSAGTRQGLKRKARRLASAGRIDYRLYATPAELADFHALARPLSALTYQERLLGAGLPDDAPARAAMARDAAADRARGWLLLVDDRPVAYLYGRAEGSTLRYEHVGHDPAWAGWSPGALLHARAFSDLFAEGRFARFDFTEGEGQHKRGFATGHVECVDLLLLRRTVANRLLVAAIAGWDGAMAQAKRATRHPALKRIADRLRR